jgi:hypothetical protein
VAEAGAGEERLIEVDGSGTTIRSAVSARRRAAMPPETVERTACSGWSFDKPRPNT